MRFWKSVQPAYQHAAMVGLDVQDHQIVRAFSPRKAPTIPNATQPAIRIASNGDVRSRDKGGVGSVA